MIKEFIPSTAYELADMLKTDVYIVGGFVRDALLGVRSDDIDIASAASADTVKAVFGDAADVVNRTLGTVKIRIGNDTYEHTQFRSESYPSGGAHTPDKVVLGATIEEDALRRDFTVNTLYWDIKKGELIDPTGRGLRDLKEMILRDVCEDTLKHDGLRILRMIRMCAEHGFKPDKELFLRAKANAKLLKDIAPERIWAELKRILSAKDPCARLMSACGAIGVIFPELTLGKGVGQKPEYHKYSVYTHNIMACECAERDFTVRLAALLHDVGKPICVERYGNMHGHDVLGAEIAEKMLKRLKADGKTIERVKLLIRWHMYDLKGDIPENTVKRKIAELGEDAFLQLMKLRDADFNGSGRIISEEPSKRFRTIFEDMVKSKAPMSIKQLAITGADIMAELKIPPSARVGRILNELLARAIRKPEINTKKRLLAEIRRIK